MRPKRRHRRRREKTTIRQGDVNTLMNTLRDYGVAPSGAFDPETREVIMYPSADDSVLEHEMIHAEQYGPLMQKLGFAPRAQDRKTRRAANIIGRRTYRDEEAYDNLGKDGFSPLKYMLDSDLEFEAIMRSAVTSPEARAVNFDQSFEDILKDLNSLPREQTNTNLRLLRTAMGESDFDDRSKRLFLRAIRSNLPS